VSEARALLELFEPYNREEAWRGIEGFSHVWLIFIFHANSQHKWKPMVRPPRRGGNRRIGVFASRSGFRPNPIGLSAVEMEGLQRNGKQLVMKLKGVDLVQGTPVLDVKPYLPYADLKVKATGGFADGAPRSVMDVAFSEKAKAFCRAQVQKGFPHLSRLIRQVLTLDPRPAYCIRKPSKATFGMRLYDFEIKWQIEAEQILVTGIELSTPQI
jgi:tRNA-Thr(GGU) m(6)t(6)A37 methyltransferase TsaA